jgi:hypothetical protein
VLTVGVSASGDDGDITVKSTVNKGYPPGGQASTSTNASTLAVGRRRVSQSYQVQTALLRFNSSPLPDNATVTSATLALQVVSKADADNRNLVGEWYAGSNWPIDSADYALDSTGSALRDIDLSTLSAGAVGRFGLQGLTNVSTTGYSGLRLHVDGGAPTGDNNVQFASFNSSGAPKPQLVIRYTIP